MAAAATAAGTASYRDAFAAQVAPGHFRELDDLVVSSIGLGTYLGEEDDQTDRGYGQAIVYAVNLGCNVFDTAINYRAQRSERVLGQALVALERERTVRREQLVLCTKGGYVPFEGGIPPDPGQYVYDAYVKTGIVQPEELVGGAHCMSPRYLDDQLGRSLRNLGLATVDVYYLHNPETQLGAVPRAVFLTRIRAAFEALERHVAAGRIGRYGVATWNGFRRPLDARDHLSLEELVEAAGAIAGPGHHFKVIQLPYNLAMPEAYAAETQLVGGQRVTILEAAKRLGVGVVASASILQGQLSRRLPNQVADALPGLDAPAQRALQFTRSTPGISVALVGMGRPEHAEENLRVARTPPSPHGVDSLFERR